MALNPNPNAGSVRDKLYASQVAAERPMMMPRIHCAEPPDIEDTLRGGEQPMHGDSMAEKFNRELRGGHAGRNDGDE